MNETEPHDERSDPSPGPSVEREILPEVSPKSDAPAGRFASHCGVPHGFCLQWQDDASGPWHTVAVPAAYLLHEGDLLTETGDASALAAALGGVLGAVPLYVQAIDGRFFVVEVSGRERLQTRGVAVVTGWVEAGETFLVERRAFRLWPGDRPPLQVDAVDAVAEDEPIAEPLLAAGFPPDFVPDLLLTTRRGRQRQRQYESQRLVSLFGSHAECKFQLNSRAVGPVHCSLVATPQGVWLVHLAAGRQTHLRGQPVRVAPVPNGSQLAIGRFEVVVEQRDAADEEGLVPDTSGRSSLPAMVPPVAASPAVSGDHTLARQLGVTSEEWSALQATASSQSESELLREVLLEMADGHQAAMTSAREMVGDVLAAQERQHQRQLELQQQQVEAIQQQNAQLMEVLQTLAGKTGTQPPAAAPPQPIVQPAQPQQITVKVETKGSELPPAAVAAPPPQSLERPPDDATQEVRDAWVRGQLHSISEELQTANRRGLKKLLGGFLRNRGEALK